MRYVCLVYNDETDLETLPDAEVEALDRHCAAHEDALRRGGNYVAGARLQPAHTATTVKVRDQRVKILDGSVGDLPEALAAFYLIDARDLNDAIRAASGIPWARLGAIEVRPVRKGEPA